MRIARSWVSIAAFAFIGCGGSAMSSGGDMGSAGAGPFAGTYAATLAETVTVTGLPPAPFAATATIAFTDGTSTDMVETISDPGGSCTFTYNRNGNTATAYPVDQSCSYVLPNGSHQTNTDSTHMAIVMGNVLTINIAGTFVGTTANHVAYSGTFAGAWMGTRK